MNQGFGDRVMYWTTINEANIYAIGGYDYGFTPPGRCSLPFIVNCSKGNSSAEPYMVALTRYLHLQRICIGEITRYITFICIII